MMLLRRPGRQAHDGTRPGPWTRTVAAVGQIGQGADGAQPHSGVGILEGAGDRIDRAARRRVRPSAPMARVRTSISLSRTIAISGSTARAIAEVAERRRGAGPHARDRCPSARASRPGAAAGSPICAERGDALAAAPPAWLSLSSSVSAGHGAGAAQRCPSDDRRLAPDARVGVLEGADQRRRSPPPPGSSAR